MLVLSFSLEALGFVVAMSLFLIAGFLILGERRPHILLSAALPVVILLALLLNALGIHIDPGVLGVFFD